MINGNISKPRKAFRLMLLSLLGVSFCVFAFGVTLKVNKSFHNYVAFTYFKEIIELDVMKHQAVAYFQDDQGQHDTAMSLIKLSIFSRSYSQSGLDMLKDNADDGYAPSQHAYGKLLLKADPFINSKEQALSYFQMSAAQGYDPSVLAIAELSEKHPEIVK